jgi:hypothetical protein
MKTPNFTKWFKETRPYKGKENILRHRQGRSLPSSHEFCWRCKGEGALKVACGPYDYNDEDCTICSGQGFILKGLARQHWEHLKELERQDAAKEKQITSELKRIKAKLTSKEVAFLEMYL